MFSHTSECNAVVADSRGKHPNIQSGHRRVNKLCKPLTRFPGKPRGHTTYESDEQCAGGTFTSGGSQEYSSIYTIKGDPRRCLEAKESCPNITSQSLAQFPDVRLFSSAEPTGGSRGPGHIVRGRFPRNFPKESVAICSSNGTPEKGKQNT